MSSSDPLVVFDVDDTLVQTHRVGMLRVQLAARVLGLAPPTEEEFLAVFARKRFHECIEVWFPGYDTRNFRDVYDREGPVIPYKPVDGASAAIDELFSQGVAVAILTNAVGFKVPLKLAPLGIPLDRFEFVWHADNSPFEKPDSRAFARLHDAGGDRPVFYVSDHPEDCAGCIAAGVHPIAVRTGVFSVHEFERAGMRREAILCSAADVSAVIRPRPSRTQYD